MMRVRVLTQVVLAICSIGLLSVAGSGVGPAGVDSRLIERIHDSKRALERVKTTLRPEVRLVLNEMLALPSRLDARPAQGLGRKAAATRERLNRYREHILLGWPSWFDTRTLPPPRPAALIALAERPAGLDSFGTPVETPWAVGYMRICYGQFFLNLRLVASPVDRVPAEALKELSREDLKRLDSVRKAGYVLADDAISQWASQSSAPRQGGVSWEGRLPPLSWFLAPDTHLATQEKTAVQEALATIYLVCSGRARDVTRYPWQFFEAAGGVIGESVMTIAPPQRHDVLQDIQEGYTIRFFVRKDLVCLDIGREPNVFQRGAGWPVLPLYKVPDWFSRDVDKLARQ